MIECTSKVKTDGGHCQRRASRALAAHCPPGVDRRRHLLQRQEGPGYSGDAVVMRNGRGMALALLLAVYTGHKSVLKTTALELWEQCSLVEGPSGSGNVSVLIIVYTSSRLT